MGRSKSFHPQGFLNSLARDKRLATKRFGFLPLFSKVKLARRFLMSDRPGLN